MSLQDWDNEVYTAIYSSIKVANETDNYKLTLTGYDDRLSTLADSFTAGGHATAEFTTYDRDNDNDNSDDYNCANKIPDAGATCESTFSGGMKVYFTLS